MMSFQVVLCGAAQGLGWATALLFSKRGWRVTILDIKPPKEVLDSKMSYFFVDLSSYKDVESTIEKVINEQGPIDALVNCVRFRGNLTPNDDSFNSWKKQLSVDLDTYFNATTLFLEKIKYCNRPASIINFSSVLSSSVNIQESLSYHAAKAAVHQMTRYLAVEYGPYNIRLNVLSPGLISRHGIEQSSQEENASFYAKLARSVPMRRSGSPQEIAKAVFFLASEDSSFITGQELIVDGGLNICEPAGVLMGDHGFSLPWSKIQNKQESRS